ncbi:uncharacterized protein LOC8078016 [Sorghum bicolor]|uniref:KIB1-4 beta-propeller domain-containing protein n=1 Tax=Sorghum bicolor TaxID=4558 RepID=A0A1B6QR28_SORBI|nr:uncharacterized protein LOC8078016 [Sorghum bicolor]KXG40374.1 hypothetical protein SORBI_3001G536200 [Sorghum bicolor]|eukprot:XP_021301806.1 uncharacterized protein LOC8078016 [Sorghum bicolor]
MRTRSQSRKLAGYLPAGSGPSGGSGAILTDPPAGCGPCVGSEATTTATATANQLRRCCGESGRPRIEAKSRLCKPWRKCTDDPSLSGGGLDPRFRPHHWIAVSYCASPSRRRPINTCTGARAEVDRPELSTHHCFGIVDGLLVLCDKASSAVRLLNPLTGALVHFPAITDVRDTQEEPLTEEEEEEEEEEGMRFLVNDTPKKKILDPSGATKINIPKPSAINGGAIDDDSDDSTTLVLALRSSLFRIICAKPGDEYWVNVHSGEQCEPVYNNKGCILFHSLLSFRGHCYVTTHEGLVMRVDLRGPPRLVYLSRSREMAVSSRSVSCISYLLRSQDHRMLMLPRGGF